MEWTTMFLGTKIVDAINWDIRECKLGELTDTLFWATNEVRYNDDTWPGYGPFSELYTDDEEYFDIEPKASLVRWHNPGCQMPHWDLGPQHLLFFLEYSSAKMIPEVESEHNDISIGRIPKSCQNLTLSIDCYADPVLQTWGSWPALGPSVHEWGQQFFTVLLFNKTGKTRGKGFKDVGNGRGLLVNFFETFPSIVFSDIVIVGLEQFFDHKPSLDMYKRFLTLRFKEKAKECGLRLHPTQFGARILFRTHRGHKIIMNRNFGKGGYDRHALK